jgi:hypothetical protein
MQRQCIVVVNEEVVGLDLDEWSSEVSDERFLGNKLFRRLKPMGGSIDTAFVSRQVIIARHLAWIKETLEETNCIQPILISTFLINNKQSILISTFYIF